MSNETPPTCAGELPEVDEDLAKSLTARGASGVRALGMLRDAYRVLTGTTMERPDEVAAACVRSAADALLSLPGAPDPPELRHAAKNLLAAVDTFPPPALRTPSSGTSAGPVGTDRPGWKRMTAAAEALRGELGPPGGFHQARARGIFEQLMGVTPSAAQDPALDVWADIYGVASRILHGRAAAPGEAVHLYTDLLDAARNLLVPLRDRAERILQLAALAEPSEKEALEIANWADPRATWFFFGSGPAPAWLEVLQEHAPHLLLADEAADVWPAGEFLEHLAAVAPETVRPWLADHVVGLSAAGPYVLGALLRLSDAGALDTAGARLLLPRVLALPPAGTPAEEASLTRRMAASWAGNFPVAARDRDWLLVVEELLKDTVDLGHAGYLAYGTARQRAHVRHEALPELTEVLQREWAARLPEHDITGLLREVVATVHRADGGRFQWARAARNAMTGLLRRDTEAPVSRSWSAYVDLEEVRVMDADFFGPILELGPLLARGVLDLAAADAAVGLPLDERTRAWPRIAAADADLHDRMLAAHLAAHPPTADTDTAGVGEWWDRAVEVTVRLLAGRPTPEGARLAALILDTCPPERAAGLDRRATAALGPAPSADEITRTLLTGDAGPEDGRVEPYASWLRVWHWSPALPARLLTGFAPLLAALRQLKKAGPPDPRTTVTLRNAGALDEEGLLALTSEAGPLVAAAAFASASDADAHGYATMLLRLVRAAPDAWTADVPRVIDALARPDLGAFYLAAVAAHCRGIPANRLGPVAVAALTLRHSLPAHETGQQLSTAAVFADRALFDLLNVVWRTGTDFGTDLPAVLVHLHGLAEPLTRPASDTPGGKKRSIDPRFPSPAVRALGSLLEYAVSRAPTDGDMCPDVLHLLADVLAADLVDEDAATEIGERLPVLHRRATAFATAHPELYALDPHRPTPAGAWLRLGGSDRLLLAALDRGQLLAAVREGQRGVATSVAFALLVDGDVDVLGDPVAAWRELATGPNAAIAVSHLMFPLARVTMALIPEDAAHTPVDIAHVWWTAALDAGLPPGALAGAGYFATSALTDEAWLPLARRSAEHTPAQEDADKVAERAARHPRSPDALILTAHLLTRPSPGRWYDAGVRPHARALEAVVFPKVRCVFSLVRREAVCGAGGMTHRCRLFAGVLVPSVMGLLEERETAARARVEELRAEAERVAAALRDAEAVLERRVIAVAELAEALGEPEPEASAAGSEPEPVEVEAVAAGSVVPRRGGRASVAVLAPDYRRIVGLVEEADAAGLRVKELARGLGLELVPGKVEGVRSKAKRLVVRGWLLERVPGVFTLPPAAQGGGVLGAGGPGAGS
ncbi:hypothetical protein LO772_30400 [Yinghuangia sp. ASG 101]|uniref:hypothetical protein n=2 Tax=Yinghuangia sp. ASG 101 TaxID=2896848 RepID=UPI001E5B8DCD|nr:hypothetical protein [Yinghuangia sp. ASG 101]UGQ11073.1 hypothetical protein LO772_30400 [Yinghuangia sp. ASG 101]